MPFFEAVQDVTPLVFDFGSAYTKCGFAGESAPRCIIPSEFKRKSGELFNVHDDSLSEEQTHDALVEFFYHIYFRLQIPLPPTPTFQVSYLKFTKFLAFFQTTTTRELVVNPKARRVVVMEPFFATTRFKHAIAHVLFTQYEVPSIYFASSHIFSILSLGIKVGLVIDCGYRETVILPVYHSFAIFKACQVLPVAGRSIQKHLRDRLMEEAVVKTEERTEVAVTSYADKLTDKLIENIKVKTCFVTRYDRAMSMRQPQEKEAVEKLSTPPAVEYPLGGRLILRIPGHIREETCEILFDRSGDDACIPSLILQSIIQCPIDTRKEMMSNLVLVGGTCMLPGFKGRLLKELAGMSKEERYKGMFEGGVFKLHTTPCMPNVAAWLGGAIFSSIEVLLSMRSTPREQYLATHRVPDWSEIRDKADVVDFKEVPFVPTPRSELHP